MVNTTFKVEKNSENVEQVIGVFTDDKGVITETVYKPNKYDFDGINEKLLNDWAVYYVNTLNGGSKNTPRIWPNHCIEGNEGHKVFPALKAALDSYARNNKANVEYHIKGQNEATEMYSVFESEVKIPDEYQALKSLYRGKQKNQNTDSKIGIKNSDDEDHANLNTDFNTTLYDSIISHNYPIVICGEALSHCVKWSALDLTEKMKTESKTRKVYLLEDAASTVNLESKGAPRDIFIESTQKFKEDTQKYISWTTTQGFINLFTKPNYLKPTQSSAAKAAVRRGGKKTSKNNKKQRLTKNQKAGKKNKSRRVRRNKTLKW
jgi:nicotinamidase-related amidase